MITWASVDLPDPFGPMTACTWPLSTSRSTPRNISWPPTAARSPDTTSLLMSAPPSAAARERARCHIGSLADARSLDFDHHVAVLDLHLVDGHGLGGGQRLWLTGLEGEGAAVLPALDLALLLPHLALAERVVLMAAAVVDGVHVVTDANHADAHPAHVEAARRARFDLVQPAQVGGRRRHQAPPPRRTASRSRNRAARAGDGRRSSTSEKKPRTMSRSATSGGTPRLSR